ncbi:S-layer homology domain-containing protein [Clostridium malenominatum]|uniref:S-layer homology domain-containing protein n=1 Tax=Clostridium malenominatum TaxID=1539 RepID=A0ABN1J6R2_9CLOT
MKNKKLISFIIGTSIAMTNYSSVLAMKLENKEMTVPTKEVLTTVEKDVRLSKEKAKELSQKVIKDYFNKTVNEKEYEVYASLSTNGERQEYFWEISWRNNNISNNTSIEVSINADTGKILRAYNRSYVDGENNNISKITEEEGQKKAEEFLKKNNPEQFKETAYIKEQRFYTYVNNSTTYTYRFARKVNGIFYNDDGLTVEIDGVKGEIISYYVNWEEGVKLSPPTNYLSTKEAEGILKKEGQLDLRYITYRDKYDTGEKLTRSKLVYMMELPYGGELDAYSGKFINSNLYEKIQKDLSTEERKEIINKLQIKQPLDKEISEGRALEIAKNNIKQLYGDGYETGSIRYFENKDGVNGASNTWTIDFSKKMDNKKGYDGGSITINALNENIVSLYKNYYMENEESKANLTWEEAYKIAINAIAKHSPEKFKEINTKATTQKNDIENLKSYGDKRYYFSFPRMVNGIPYMENNITVSVDAAKGHLVEYRLNWNENMKFDAPEKLIQKEEASKILFNKSKTELSYRKINKSTDYSKPDWETKLIYTIRDSYNYNFTALRVDGFTGKILNDSGEEIDENIEVYMKKIKGSPYEKELTILAHNGVMDTASFEATKEITKMDFIKMLVNAKGYRPYLLKESSKLSFDSGMNKSDANYKYLQLAVHYGILENKEGKFDPKEKVTRNDMAKILVKFLGYDKLANSKDIFSLKVKDLKDIKNEDIGYIAIAKGLGILQEQNNNIRPKANATWTELSIGVYKVLDNIRRGY